MKSTPNRIWARREELGLSRADLAHRLQMTKMRVYRIEKGITGIGVDELPAWARALKTTVAELVA